jgi:hypothetical protein
MGKQNERTDVSTTETKTAPKLTKAQAAALYDKAACAAEAAYLAAKPTPMVVGTPKNLLGSLTGGDDGGLDPSQPVYHVPGGVCGFAWVTLRPARGALATLLKAKGGHKGYYGGVELSSGYIVPGARFDQSLERNEAAAKAFAAVLQEAGFQAYAGSRLD